MTFNVRCHTERRSNRERQGVGDSGHASPNFVEDYYYAVGPEARGGDCQGACQDLLHVSFFDHPIYQID
jgi:hypothetical protein